jgi:single-strand DNA-binding protein
MRRGNVMVAKTVTKRRKAQQEEVAEDFSLNDLVLRGRVSQEAVEKELPSGDKVVEFRLIVTRDKQSGVDTLDIGAWSSKARRTALTLTPDQWVEVSGSIHRRFWSGPTGLASRWQVEAVEITRI